MSYTATQFIDDALTDLGCLVMGQTATSQIHNAGLRALNQWVDGLLLDEMLVFTIAINDYNLTAGSQVYTIGPNETVTRVINGVTTQPIQATRPTRIDYANIILNTVSPVVRQPVEILRDDKQWGRIRVQQIPFAIPRKLYYDGGFDPTNGYGVIYLWPGPQSSYQLELFTWQQLQNFASLSAAYIFPPGYARMIRKGLAVEMAPMARAYYKLNAAQFDIHLADVKKQYRQARAEVESYNAPETAVLVNPAWTGSNRKASFNYGTGDVGSPR